MIPETPSRKIYQGRGLLIILLVVMFVVGAGMVVLDLGTEVLNGDEYNLIQKVDRSFSSFLKHQYGKSLTLQFWICDRLFGGSLAGYRVPGALSGVLNLLLILVIVGLVWPRRASAVVAVGFLLSFNEDCLYFFRWGMAIYGEYILLSTVLFFSLMYIAKKRLQRPYTYLAFVVAAILPWIYPTLLIGLLSGALLVLIARTWKSTGSRLRSAWEVIWELKYLFPVVPMYVLFRAIQPLQMISRANLDPFIFTRTDYPQSLFGALHFGWDRTTHFFELLLNVKLGLERFQTSLGRVVLDDLVTQSAVVLLVIGILLTFVRRPIDRNRVFTIAYLAVSMGIMYVLSLAGIYPYGNPRYAMILLCPILVLIGLGVADMLDLALKKPIGWLAGLVVGQQTRARLASGARKTLLLGAILVILLGGINRLLDIHEKRQALQVQYDRFLAIINEDDSDLALVDMSNYSWLGALFPWLYDDAEYLASPFPFHRTAPSDALVASAMNSENPIRTILIVTFGNSMHSEWMSGGAEKYPSYARLFPPEDFLICASESVRPAHVTRVSRKPFACSGDAVGSD